MEKRSFRSVPARLALLALAMLGAALLSLCLGAAAVSPREILSVLSGGGKGTTAASILLYVRLPRTLGCLLAGAALAVSGAVIQTVLANPLAAPNIIGVNSGAGLGVALCCAVLPTAAAAVLGWGLTVLALAAGLAAFVKAFFPEKKLRDIVKKKNLWWLLGGAAALAALDEVLPLVWAGYSTAAAFVKLAGGAAILGGTVTAAVRGEKRREREREEAEIEAMEEPKLETMEEARRRVLRMADETAEFRF